MEVSSTRIEGIFFSVAMTAPFIAEEEEIGVNVSNEMENMREMPIRDGGPSKEHRCCLTVLYTVRLKYSGVLYAICMVYVWYMSSVCMAYVWLFVCLVFRVLEDRKQRKDEKAKDEGRRNSEASPMLSLHPLSSKDCR